MEPLNEPPQSNPPQLPPAAAPPVIAYCRACGKGLTEEMSRNYQGTIYCAEHVPQTTSSSGQSEWSPGAAATVVPPPVSRAAGTSPGLAFVLGLIPGVGAIYNGQYAKGFVHVLITGVLFTLTSHDAGAAESFFEMFIPVWFAYMAFEAYHTAKKQAAGEPVDEFSSIFPNQAAQGLPILPLLLIALGVLFLLNNLDIIRIRQLAPYAGPLFLIGLGVYLLYARMRANAVGEVSHERR